MQSTQTGTGATFPTAVAMDASGDAIVVGSFYQSVSLGGTTVTSDFNNMSGFVWKLNYSSGATDWAVQVDTTGGGSSSQAGYSGMSGERAEKGTP